MPSILFLDTEESDQALVTKTFPEARFAAGGLTGKKLIEACKDAEVISPFITTSFPRNIIASLPALKLLVTRSVGYDHIDTLACRERGITVCNVPDYGSHVIAEHVFALLLATLRNIHLGHERVQSGRFDYHGLRGMALKGKTIGIIGTGKIGRAAARIAHGFDMQILATDQCRVEELEKTLSVRYVALDELLSQSDIVTLHVPSTKETEHMIDARAFNLMKDGAILVNTARGSLIDSTALLTALKSGKVAHALLDVLEHENNFEENKALVSHPNVVTTPHVAFYADDSMCSMYMDAFQSIREWQSGSRPAHVIPAVTKVCDLPPVMRK